MNPITTLLTLLVSLLPLSLSAGELDGKSLVCETQLWFFEPHIPEVRGFHFVDGEVVGEELVVEGRDLNWQPSEPAQSLLAGSLSYIDNPEEIKWWGSEYNLNRETLILLWKKLVMTKGGIPKTYQRAYLCEVFETRESYTETLSRYKQEGLEKLREKMKDNKI